MNTQTDFSIAEAARISENLIRLGTVAELDTGKARVRVKIGELQTDWIPWLVTRAGKDVSWWSPSIGEQMIVFSPSGDLSQSVCLGAIYSDSFPANGDDENTHRVTYRDNAVLEYDRNEHKLTITLPSNGTVNIVANVNITGDVQITGNVTASEDITDKTRSMQGDRNIYNQHTHAHPQGGQVSATQQRQ